MKTSDALELVAYAEATWNYRTLTDDSRAVWVRVMRDVDPAAGLAAVDEIAAETTFFPTPQAVRLRAMSVFGDFEEVWAELKRAANTCDWFDPEPPRSLSPEAWTLARSLGWADFRVSDPENTYYQHSARMRFDEIIARARRRIAEGIAPFELPTAPSEIAEIAMQIGEDA